MSSKAADAATRCAQRSCALSRIPLVDSTSSSTRNRVFAPASRREMELGLGTPRSGPIRLSRHRNREAIQLAVELRRNDDPSPLRELHGHRGRRSHGHAIRRSPRLPSGPGAARSRVRSSFRALGFRVRRPSSGRSVATAQTRRWFVRTGFRVGGTLHRRSRRSLAWRRHALRRPEPASLHVFPPEARQSRIHESRVGATSATESPPRRRISTGTGVPQVWGDGFSDPQGVRGSRSPTPPRSRDHEAFANRITHEA